MTRGSDRAMAVIMTAMRFVTGGTLLLLLVFGLINIVLRWTTSTGLIWYNDLARFGLIWATMAGAVIVSLLGEHLIINDTLQQRFPPWLAIVARIIRVAATTIFLTVVVVEGTRLTMQAMGQGFVTVRWLPLGLGYAAMPIGAVLMLVVTLVEALGGSRTQKDQNS